MVKITDVARRAGASPSTVSYALSGKRPISDGTRRRVEEAAHDLGHRPHTAAPALAGGKPQPWSGRPRSAPAGRTGEYVTPNGMTKAPPQISDGAFAHMG